MQRWPVTVMIVVGICASFLLQNGSVNAQSFDRALCQKSTTSTGTITGPDPFWAVYDGRSIELVACETTGVAGTLTCPSPGAPPGNVGLSLSPDGPFTPEVRATTTWGNCGSGCMQSPPIYIKGLTDGPTKVDICPAIGQGFAIGCFARGPGIYQVYTVQSMEFDPQNTSLEDWNGGKRIFPGKENPADTINHRFVGVKATTNAQPPNPNVFDQLRAKVIFKSVDMDDPTTDNAPIDGNGEQGNDNRGTPKTGRIVGGNNIDIDANGAADTTFEATMHPGDNFKVIAGCDQTYLNGLTGLGPNVVDANGANITSTQRAHASDLLTVWRKLHIEWDEMSFVEGNRVTGIIKSASSGTTLSTITIDTRIPETDRFEGGQLHVGGQSFHVLSNQQRNVFVSGPVDETLLVNQLYVLVDDDDFNLNQQGMLNGDETEKVMKNQNSKEFLEGPGNVFSPAFIEPVFDGGGNPGNDDGELSFKLNLDSDKTSKLLMELSPATGRDSANNGKDDFWVAYLRSAYQSISNEDKDPTSEPATAGIAPASVNTNTWMDVNEVQPGGEALFIFHEGEKEIIGGLPLIHAITPAHELGHALGLGHDSHLMSDGINLPGAELKFSDKHLNNLRWRVHSPGK